MKKCPKCKAEIGEEARFCLYCMTSFEEKQTIETPKENNKRWLIIIAAVLVLVFTITCILLFAQKDDSINGENDTSLTSSISSDLDASDDNDTTSSEQQNSETQGNEASTPTSNNQTQAPSKNEGSTTNNTSGNTTTNNSTTSNNSQNSNTNNTTANNSTTSSNSQNNNTNNTTNNTSNSTSTNSTSSGNKTDNDSSNSGTTASNSTPSTSTATDNTTSSDTSSTPTVTQPQYTYIEATIQNAYPTGYSAMYAPENAIVITKVNYKEENGNYVIPDTIDGKKVAAIMPSAFSDSSISSSVKSVTLPSTVRTIWSDAFKNCYNLTDLYLKSAVIGIYEDAFPLTLMRNGKLTIHCKRDCRDFDFYYYRNIADRYDADYKEWNG